MRRPSLDLSRLPRHRHRPSAGRRGCRQRWRPRRPGPGSPRCSCATPLAERRRAGRARPGRRRGALRGTGVPLLVNDRVHLVDGDRRRRRPHRAGRPRPRRGARGSLGPEAPASACRCRPSSTWPPRGPAAWAPWTTSGSARSGRRSTKPDAAEPGGVERLREIARRPARGRAWRSAAIDVDRAALVVRGTGVAGRRRRQRHLRPAGRRRGRIRAPAGRRGTGRS